MADTWTVALGATLSQVTLGSCPLTETEIMMLPATARVTMRRQILIEMLCQGAALKS